MSPVLASMAIHARLLLIVPFLAWFGNAQALGLGKIVVFSNLGEPLRAEVEVLTAGKEFIDATCFQLRHPDGDGDLPWIQRGTLKLRQGASPVIEIRTARAVNEPVIQVGLVAFCGNEVRRDFTLLLSPPEIGGRVDSPPVAIEAPRALRPAPPMRPPRRPVASDSEARMPSGTPEWSPPAMTRPRRQKPPAQAAAKDRVVVSGNSELAGVPSLRMTTELTGGAEDSDSAKEIQRGILRMEFRMMMALQELTATQATSAEKLRTLQSVLEAPVLPLANELPPAGSGTATVEAAPPQQNAAVVGISKPAAVEALPPARTKAADGDANAKKTYEWAFYGGLLVALLVIGSWLAWRQYRARQAALADASDFPPSLAPDASPVWEKRDHFIDDEFDDRPVKAEPPVAEEHGEITDIEVIDPLATAPVDTGVEPPPAAPELAAVPSIEQQFDAQPVLELADIMMSFGRTKGAAQVLHEYIEQKPKEALQPWLRLMDVYRQAGMREEFERLVEDFHLHFNVEVQRWSQQESEVEAAPGFSLELVLPGEEKAPSSAPAKPQSLEDFGHIRDKLIDTWRTPECLTYLHHLLRDNRGGQRAGFPLPVVSEILCLIELLEAPVADAPASRELAPLPFE
ncbi:MAG TPA: hypothetical protein VFF03_14395 [Rhodocyclaceae bacterium]|nr:hypothetical protein [Rhodocyclaceae bacterium]